MSDASDCPPVFSSEPPLVPASVADLTAMVRQAVEDDTPLFPLGGRTHADLGLPPTRPGRCVDLRQLNQVIDYPARDMTVTVQAGITMAQLRQVLDRENQRLPIDVPMADRATLGGSLAVNASGPRRLGFGTFRDYVLGVSFVNDAGQEVKAGGRVVKNVAGYDLCKLMIGSLGTLGILTQVTLKVKPKPEDQALVAIGCDADKIDAVLDWLHGSRTRPVCIELLNAAAASAVNGRGGHLLPASPWVVVVGFEDNLEATPWQATQLIKELPLDLCRGLDVRASGTSQSLWDALVELPGTPSRFSFKANLLPRGVAEFCRLADGLGDGLLIHSHAGSGIVTGHAADNLTPERAGEVMSRLLDAATAAAGNVILPRCPADWKRSLPVWGRPRGDLWVMRRVKEKLDPKRLFNPGRYIGGF